MSDRDESVAKHQDPGTSHPDPIANLVRLAGARQPAPPERAARVEAMVRAAWQQGVAARRRRRVAIWSSSLAAAAVLLVLVGVAWRRAATPPLPPQVVAHVERATGTVGIVAAGVTRPLRTGDALRTGERLETAPDARVALRLAGGPSLRVDSDSRLLFTAPAALRLDAGAVYVDSQGGPPVSIDSQLGRVEERGTQFEVRVVAGALRVRVREGSVRLAASAGAWQALAGSELLLAADGRVARGTVPLHGDAWAWVQQIAPSFQLEGRTLGDFLGWAGRESGSRLAWADPTRAARARAIVLHGSVDGLPPDQALAAVLPTCGLASRRDGSTLVLFASSH